MNKKPPAPKLSHAQAKQLWNSLNPQQKSQFNEMMRLMQEGKLHLDYVGVDDNETIQHIVLKPKDKPSLPTAPYAKHFKQAKV